MAGTPGKQKTGDARSFDAFYLVSLTCTFSTVSLPNCRFTVNFPRKMATKADNLLIHFDIYSTTIELILTEVDRKQVPTALYIVSVIVRANAPRLSP